MRAAAIALVAFAASACATVKLETPAQFAAAYSADAKAACDLVPKVYAFYAPRAAHWAEACAQAQAEAAHVTSHREGVGVMEHLVDALWDNHASLGSNTATSPWLVPSGSDMWLEAKADAVVITGVRHGGAADRAGVRVGDTVISINGKTPRDAAMERIRTGRADISPARLAFALNAAGASNRGQDRRIVLSRAGREIAVTLGKPAPGGADEAITARLIGNVGYVRFNDSLGDTDTVAAFDKAVDTLRGAKAWIVDLRDTGSGGTTDVAEPVMGRFMDHAANYQVTLPLNAPPEMGRVVPRGATLEGRVVVLVGRWTGSMGEGMAIGFDGMQRASVIGGAMAGLAGGVEVFTLPATNTRLRLPAYGLSHIDGTPRPDWTPKVLVQPDAGGADDPALARAIEILAQAN